METGAITGYIDIAQLTLYAFWIFFFGLIIYLRREDTREGYPLESDVGGRVRKKNFLFYPKAKEFILPHGEGIALSPPGDRDTRPVKAERTAPWPGAAYRPTGDPMLSGMGPGAYAERSKHPELDIHGNNMLLPLRALPGFSVPRASRDPRGFDVVGADGVVVGKVTELWVTRAEQDVRHFEVERSGKGTFILPVRFGRVNLDTPRVTVAAIKGSQFAQVPTLAKRDEMTPDEEERIQAYYGGGYLYADPKRAEPLV